MNIWGAFMLRWKRGNTIRERIRNNCIHNKLGVPPVEDKIREN